MGHETKTISGTHRCVILNDAEAISGFKQPSARCRRKVGITHPPSLPPSHPPLALRLFRIINVRTARTCFASRGASYEIRRRLGLLLYSSGSYPSKGASRGRATLSPFHPHGYLYPRPCNFADVKGALYPALFSRPRRRGPRAELPRGSVAVNSEISRRNVNISDGTLIHSRQWDFHEQSVEQARSPRSRSDRSFLSRALLLACSSRTTNKFSHSSCKSQEAEDLGSPASKERGCIIYRRARDSVGTFSHVFR